MARHTEEENKRGSSGKYVVQPVIPALPLCPVKKRTTSDNKTQESAQTKKGTTLDIKSQETLQTENADQNSTSGPLESGGWSTPDHGLKLQFGELEGDHEHVVDSPPKQPDSSSDVATSTSLCGMFAPRQNRRLDSQNSLPHASINDTSTQDVSSRPSSASATPKMIPAESSHTPQRTLQTSVVELPDASIPYFSALNISFVYQEDLDSASSASTICSGSPTVFTPPSTTSEQRTPSGMSYPRV